MRILGFSIAAVLILALGGLIVKRLAESSSGPKERPGPGTPAVEVADVARRPIALTRVSSGTLEASAEFVVAPKVGGRIERVHVDLSDPVRRRQVVVELEDAEFKQAVAQAKAELAVAEANVTESKSAHEVAQRELARLQPLESRGVATAAELDTLRARVDASAAAVLAAEARKTRADALLEAARLREGYTQVTADWYEPDPEVVTERVVAERFVDDGQTVTANAPLLTIVEIDSIVGVIHVAERDYGRIQVGQKVVATTDAHPGDGFEGHVSRIASVFRESSRQARVEFVIPNVDRRLKPGMFVRAEITLDRVEEATTVPVAAIVQRQDRQGVFRIDRDGTTVHWCPVVLGIRDGGDVQIVSPPLEGRVVVLGQQLLSDGMTVRPTASKLRGGGAESVEAASASGSGGS